MNEIDVKKKIVFINKLQFYNEGGSKMYTELIDEFNNINQKYIYKDSGSIEKLELERMADVGVNEDDIKRDAEKALFDYQNQNLTTIEDKYTSGIEKTNQKEEDKVFSAESKKESIESKLETNKKTTENKLFARGLGRSSIIINNQEAFDTAVLKEYALIDEKLSRELSLLEREREVLLEQKNFALASFDIAYASKLSDKIESINKDLAKKQTEVDKYNASIAKQEADYEANQQKEIDSHNKILSQIIDKNGILAINILKQKDKYEAALAYFNGISADAALTELTNNKTYKEQLGDDRYDLLIKKMWERF